jgi:hypothetical protein
MPFKETPERRAYRRAHYLKNRERYLENAREQRRRADPVQQAAYFRAIYERNHLDPAYRRKVSEYQRRRRAADYEHVRDIERASYERHRAERIATQRALSRTPEYLARAYVNRQIRDGKLPRASTKPCVRCGKRAREYHHHLGYEREHWLDVTPVCSVCHRATHLEVPGRAKST